MNAIYAIEKLAINRLLTNYPTIFQNSNHPGQNKANIRLKRRSTPINNYFTIFQNPNHPGQNEEIVRLEMKAHTVRVLARAIDNDKTRSSGGSLSREKTLNRNAACRDPFSSPFPVAFRREAIMNELVSTRRRCGTSASRSTTIPPFPRLATEGCCCSDEPRG